MSDVLLIAFLFLAAGVAAVPIAAKLGFGSVLGYLVAGIALAPVLAGLDVDVVAIQHFAEFGVVMMLFLIGLELEPRRLWQMRGRLLGLGGLQVGFTAAAIAGIGMALGLPWQSALGAGLVLTLSSTAIVLQTLQERGLMRSDAGQGSFAVLLFQDIAVIPMLALIPLLAVPELAGGPEGAAHGPEAGGHGAGHGDADGGAHGPGMSLVAGQPPALQALITLGAVALVIAGGILATRPVFRFIALARLREIFVATALLWVIAIALLMTLVGLSPALGTFLAGVVLANSEYRHELEANIEPFKGLLLGLFFMTVGASIDFGLLAGEAPLVLALTLGLMALKAAILLALTVPFGIRGGDRFLFGLGLAQAGEFGFVLLGLSLSSGVIGADLAARLLLVVALSMLLTPALFILQDRVIAPRLAAAREPDRAPDEIPDADQAPIIIAGHGRFGGVVNRMLRGLGHKTTVLDFSSAQLEMIRTFGFEVFFGDATRPDLLEAAGIARARMLVICIDGREDITRLAAHVAKTYPHVHVIARAIDRRHVYELWAAGCRDIIRETFDSATRAGRSALEALGIDRETAEEKTRAFVAIDRKHIAALADVYDPDLPIHRNEAYVARARGFAAEMERLMRGEIESLRAAGEDGAEEDGAGRGARAEPPRDPLEGRGREG